MLANLANFAYDPINYDHLHKLNVLDLFLDSLTESDPKLIEFALGGLCNCCPGTPLESSPIVIEICSQTLHAQNLLFKMRESP